jgi:hypothetical protein
MVDHDWENALARLAEQEEEDVRRRDEEYYTTL